MLSDFELNSYIQSDIKDFDLSTSLQNPSKKQARLDIYTREELCLSSLKEAARIAKMLACEAKSDYLDSQRVLRDKVILSIEGDYSDVHKAWKLCQIMLEYSLAISTYTAKMLESIKSVNPNCALLATRKSFPFAKSFCIQAILCAGAGIHRLNLSDSVLFFEQHRVYYEKEEDFFKNIALFKLRAPEKKIVVESTSIKDAKRLLKAGVDALQLDKMQINDIEEIIKYKNKNYKNIKILCAGGINLQNAKSFANTQCDALISSAMYFKGGMADLGSKMKLLN